MPEIARCQGGVLTRAQALSAGLTRATIAAHLAAHRWRRVLPGVYATFTGPLPRRSLLWAIALHAGPHAVLSHESAAELIGLINGSTNVPVHVTVPAGRRVRPLPGVVVHRSRHAAKVRHPSREPPQTRVEDTVLDLTQTAPTVEDAIGWLARAIGARMTTADRLRTAMAQRRRLRWRRLLHATVTDAAEGSHSLLELLYLHRVERAHGLPRSHRQARRADGRYDDVLYREYATRVELDGRANHPLHLRWRDHRRDNDAVEVGDRPLRYGLADVDQVPCAVALQVVRVLRRAGWTGTPQACGRPGCQLGTSTLTAVD